MDKHTLKITPRALREKLEIIKDQNPDAMTMLNLLRDLLFCRAAVDALNAIT